MWVGDCSVEVVPSPKSQSHETILPSWSNERSVKVAETAVLLLTTLMVFEKAPTGFVSIFESSSLHEIIPKIENRNISLDIEFDNEGTTLKDFIQETESFEAEHNVHSKKADVIKKYICNLKEPYRTVIEMREIDRMSYKDIADKLKKNLSTVKSQIRNGRHLLIEQSKREFEEIDEMFL